jgi:uncharacterized SAM-binding protein YcdF (DUF218 family)
MGPFWVQTSRYDDVLVSHQSRDAALVLGAALWDSQPSPALTERLQMALYLYNKGQVQWIICSGGIGDDGISEAKGMKRYLVDRGVPPKDLLLEEESTNTEENLRYSKKLLKPNGIQNIYLVTHDYHMYRALALARNTGIPAEPAPVHSQVLFSPYYKARECLSIIKYYLTK